MEGNLNSLLATERQHLEAEAADLQMRVREAQERLSLVQRRLEHVRALLDDQESSESQDAMPQTQHNYNTGNRSHVCDIAEAVLSERNGEPMYYKELAQEVIRRGGDLYGATPWANLTARMVQDPRFVRPTAKGFYALRRDYPNARNVGARRQRRRRTG